MTEQIIYFTPTMMLLYQIIIMESNDVMIRVRNKCASTINSPVITNSSFCQLTKTSINLGDNYFTVQGLTQLDGNEINCTYTTFMLTNSSLSHSVFIMNATVDVGLQCTNITIAPIIADDDSTIDDLTISGTIRIEIEDYQRNARLFIQPIIVGNRTKINRVDFSKFQSNHSESQAFELLTAPVIRNFTFQHRPITLDGRQFSIYSKSDPEQAYNLAFRCLQTQLWENDALELPAQSQTIYLRNRMKMYECNNCKCEQCLYFNNSCVKQCPVDHKDQDSECMHVSQLRSKVPYGPDELYVAKASYPCELGVYQTDNHVCSGRCPKNFSPVRGVCLPCARGLYSSGFKCVTPTCPIFQLFSNGHCVDVCPGAAHHQMCVDRCPPLLVQHNGRCEPYCPKPLVNDSGICAFVCEAGYKLGPTCVSQCPTHYETDKANRLCLQNRTNDAKARFRCRQLFEDAITESDTVKLMTPRDTEDYKSCMAIQSLDSVKNGTQQCPIGMYMYNSQCRPRCQVGLLTNVATKTCGFDCSVQLRYKAHCVSHCPSDTYQNGGECVTSCPHSYDPTARMCINVCDSPEKAWMNAELVSLGKKYNIKKQCVMCPANMRRVRTTLDYECMKSCSNDSADIDGTCYEQHLCQFGYLNIDTNLCQSECGHGYYYNDNSKICVKKCPKDTITNLVTLRCQTVCPEYGVLFENQCHLSCPQGLYNVSKICVKSCNPLFLVNQTCQKQCPKQLWGFQGECLQSCPTNTFQYNNQCNYECPSRTVKLDKTCMDENTAILEKLKTCPDDLYLLARTGECVNIDSQTNIKYKNILLDSCPNGLLLSDGNICVEACDLHSLEYNNTCLKQCPAFTRAAHNPRDKNHKYCSSQCPGDEFIDKLGNCVKVCPPGTVHDVSKMCLTECTTPNFLAEFQSRSCVQKCSPNLYQLNNQSCVSTCPPTMYASDQQKKCVIQCIRPYVADPETMKCQSSCSQKYLDQDGHCVSVCDLNKFIDFKTRKCVNKCEFQALGTSKVCLAGWFNTKQQTIMPSKIWHKESSIISLTTTIIVISITSGIVAILFGTSK